MKKGETQCELTCRERIQHVKLWCFHWEKREFNLRGPPARQHHGEQICHVYHKLERTIEERVVPAAVVGRALREIEHRVQRVRSDIHWEHVCHIDLLRPRPYV